VDAESLPNLLLGGGFGAVFVAVVNGLMQRRKVGADATETITAAALSVVRPLQDQVEAAHREMARQREDVDRIRAQLRECQERADRLAEKLTEAEGRAAAAEDHAKVLAQEVILLRRRLGIPPATGR
jgi:septation ring formation regulator EzrA